MFRRNIYCEEQIDLEYIPNGKIGYTQEELEEIDYNYDFLNTPYELAEIFTEEVANKNNFFNNSIGYWELTSIPSIKPHYVSHSDSEYWYTSKGVYRRSDHWGFKIASCSWFIEDDLYEYEGDEYDIKFYDSPVTAFIPWSNLKAKGEIVQDRRTHRLTLHGFTFDNNYYFGY